MTAKQIMTSYDLCKDDEDRNCIENNNYEPLNLVEPRWIKGELELCQKYFFHNQYIYAHVDEEKSLEKKKSCRWLHMKENRAKSNKLVEYVLKESCSKASNNLIPLEPKWIPGELILCQKYFYHNQYIYAHIDTTTEKLEEKSKKTRKSRKKKEKSNASNPNVVSENKTLKDSGWCASDESLKSTSILNTRNNCSVEKNDTTDNTLPAPGTAAQSVLTLLNHFHSGLTKLFPDSYVHKKLKVCLSESDSIHLMMNMNSLISVLDEILENQVMEHMSKHNTDITNVTSRPDLLNQFQKNCVLKLSENK